MKHLHKLAIAALGAAFFMASALAQNSGTVSNHAIPLGKGPGVTGYGSLTLPNGQIPVGQTSADPQAKALSGDVTMDNAGVTAIGANKVTNTKINPGAANTFKGTLNGSATSDIALTACTLSYQITKWVAGTGWQCGINPVLPSRAIAATLDLSAYTSITVQGYYNAGDGGWMTMTKVGSQPFCGPYTSTAAFQDTASNWWNISEPNEFNIRQFGAKQDAIWQLSTGTDDTAAIQSAMRCAAPITGGGDDIGGGAGKRVRVPPGWSFVSSTLTVPNQVPVVGPCPVCAGFVMTLAFPVNAHFVILGDQYTQTDVAAAQSRGSAGNLTINSSSQWHRAGAIYLFHPQVPAIYSASNNSGVNFTFTGTDRYGNAQTDTIAGPTAGGIANSGKFYLTITQVSTSAATVGNVSVGFPQIASFASRLQDLQLYSGNQNATNFSTSVNNPSSGTPTAGVSGNAMVYSNSAQHTGGLERVKIFAGNRSASIFEFGVGGASTVTYRSVETFNSGACGGSCTANPQIYWNYAGLLVDMDNIVQGGPGVVSAGAASVCMLVVGGHINLRNWHCESIVTGLKNSITSSNNGSVTIMNSNAATAMTTLVRIDAGVPANNTNVQGIFPNGSTHTVDNNGVFNNTNITQWTSF